MKCVCGAKLVGIDGNPGNDVCVFCGKAYRPGREGITQIISIDSDKEEVWEE